MIRTSKLRGAGPVETASMQIVRRFEESAAQVRRAAEAAIASAPDVCNGSQLRSGRAPVRVSTWDTDLRTVTLQLEGSTGQIAVFLTSGRVGEPGTRNTTPLDVEINGGHRQLTWIPGQPLVVGGSFGRDPNAPIAFSPPTDVPEPVRRVWASLAPLLAELPPATTPEAVAIVAALQSLVQSAATVAPTTRGEAPPPTDAPSLRVPGVLPPTTQAPAKSGQLAVRTQPVPGRSLGTAAQTTDVE
jgi:hypothetical protein